MKICQDFQKSRFNGGSVQFILTAPRGGYPEVNYSGARKKYIASERERAVERMKRLQRKNEDKSREIKRHRERKSAIKEGTKTKRWICT